MKFRSIALSAVAAAGALGLAVAGYAEQSSGKRTPADVAALDADAIVAAVNENLGFLAVYTAEAHRRHPQVPLIEGVALPNVTAESQARLRAMPDQQVLRAMQILAGENDQLVARYKLLRPADRDPDESRPAAPASRPQGAAPSGKADYCYQMYGRAYSLCGREDRSCKIVAADQWGTCKQTGRWP
jgi:hypothetical protein